MRAKPACLIEILLCVTGISETSFVSLCVGYKMKTCMQIWDCRFCGKINVVSLCVSAKQASRGRRADTCHVLYTQDENQLI